MSNASKLNPNEEWKGVNQTSNSFIFSNKRRNFLLTTDRKSDESRSKAIPQSKFTSKTGSIDDYEMGDLLGRGAYGEVYQATQIATNQKFAIKVYDKYKMGEVQK